MISLFMVLLASVASATISVNGVNADSIETLVLPEDCLKDQYYDSTQMICSNCSNNLLIVDTRSPPDSRYSNDYALINFNGDNPLLPESPDEGTTDSSSKSVEKENGNFLHSSLDHFSCRCPEGFYKTRGDQRYLFRCFKCPDHTVTSISGYECAKCLQNKVYQQNNKEKNSTENSSQGPTTTTTPKPVSLWMSLVRPATATTMSNETIVTEIPATTTTKTSVNDFLDLDKEYAPKVTCLDNCDHLKNSFINERLNEDGQLEKYCHQCSAGSRANQQELRCDPCHESIILRQPIQQQRLSARLMHLNGNNHQFLANQKELQSSLSCRCDESDGYSLIAGTCLTHQSHQAILNEFLALSYNVVGLDTSDLSENRRDILAGIDIGSSTHRNSIDSSEPTTQHVLNRVRFFDSDETQVDDIDTDSAYLSNELSSSSERTKQPPKIIISEFIAKYLVSTIDQCKNHRNLTACQMWSNMCVMTVYSHHDTHHSIVNSPTTGMHRASNIHRKVPLQTSNVCNYLKEHLKKSSLGRKNDIANIFVENEAIDELYKVNIPNTYKINQEVQFIAFRWNSRGILLGASEFKLDELRLCSSSSKVSSSRNTHHRVNSNRHKQGFNSEFPFGRNFHESCDVPIDMLINRLMENSNINEEPGIFYDVYLVVHTNDAPQIRPVPILIKNLAFNGQHINRNDDISRWRLVRRFFLTDIIASTSAELQASNSSSTKIHHYLRYPRSIDLNIRLRKRDGTGSIYPPLLIIDYESIEITDIIASESNSNQTFVSSNKKSMNINTELRITYSMSNSSLEKNGEALLGLLCLLSGFWSLIKSYTWCRRCGKTSIDLWTIFQYFIMMGNMLANLLLLSIFVITFYCLIVYKFQTAPFTVLPTRQQESSLITYINVAFILKAVGLINEFYWRINSDIFFLDWERSKQASFIDHHQHVNHISTKSPNNDHYDEPQKSRQVDNATNDQKLSRINCFDNCGKSIWRCYFIYNRWLSLQTKRRINVIFQLFVSISILEVRYYPRKYGTIHIQNTILITFFSMHS